MISGDGSGNQYIKYVGDTVVIGTNGADRVVVSRNGDVQILQDLVASGGTPEQFAYRGNPQQGRSMSLSSSLANPSEGLTGQAAVRNGSIVGLGMYSPNSTISAGALTASVTINGVQQSGLTLIMTAGSGSVVTIAKDIVSFGAGAGLGIAVTASADYVNSVATTSGTFFGSLLIEQ